MVNETINKLAGISNDVTNAVRSVNTAHQNGTTELIQYYNSNLNMALASAIATLCELVAKQSVRIDQLSGGSFYDQ